jgi:hypothetical protein
VHIGSLLVYRLLPYLTYSSYKCLGERSPSLYDMWADAVCRQITINYQIRASSILYRVYRSDLDIFLLLILYHVLCRWVALMFCLKLKFLDLAVDGVDGLILRATGCIIL